MEVESAEGNLPAVPQILTKVPGQKYRKPIPSGDAEQATSSEIDKKRRRKDKSSSNEYPVAEDGSAPRNNWQMDKRKELDNYSCIINGTRGFDVAHIMPHSANETPEVRGRLEYLLQSLRHFLPAFEHLEWRAQRQPILDLCSMFASDTGVSDRRWNMICLDKQLHDWWGSAYFAFKCLGLDTLDTLPGGEEEDEKAGGNEDPMVSLKLQFHWMPKRLATNAKPLTTEERTKDAYLAQFNGTWGNPNDPSPRVAFYRSNGRLLITGDIFHVKVRNRHWEKMKQAFDIQWALTRIAAMAGGAEAIEEEWDNYDEDGGIHAFAAKAHYYTIKYLSTPLYMGEDSETEASDFGNEDEDNVFQGDDFEDNKAKGAEAKGKAVAWDDGELDNEECTTPPHEDESSSKDLQPTDDPSWSNQQCGGEETMRKNPKLKPDNRRS